jgi:hypothetical protein
MGCATFWAIFSQSHPVALLLVLNAIAVRAPIFTEKFLQLISFEVRTSSDALNFRGREKLTRIGIGPLGHLFLFSWRLAESKKVTSGGQSLVMSVTTRGIIFSW